MPHDDGAVELPIDGILDLHAFAPGDAKSLVPEYLALWREKGIFRVRIIHGKGTGALRETVRATLARTAGVSSFAQAGEEEGGWGATIVFLDPPTKPSSSPSSCNGKTRGTRSS